MKLTDGRINYLSREVAKSFMAASIVDAPDLDPLAKEVKKGFVFFVQSEVAVDKKVREKIASLKRGVPEGSAEWDLLYRKYFSEEIEKL